MQEETILSKLKKAQAKPQADEPLVLEDKKRPSPQEQPFQMTNVQKISKLFKLEKK